MAGVIKAAFIGGIHSCMALPTWGARNEQWYRQLLTTTLVHIQFLYNRSEAELLTNPLAWRLRHRRCRRTSERCIANFMLV